MSKPEPLNIPIDYQAVIKQLSQRISELVAQNATLSVAVAIMREMLADKDKE